MIPLAFLGAQLHPDEVAFRVWAPAAHTLDVVLEDPGGAATLLLHLKPKEDGYFEGRLRGQFDQWLYRFRVNGGNEYPDPASRFQPHGVHGSSQILDLSRFPWSDADWHGPDPTSLVIYELHVGTFSPEGTFAGVTRRLPWLKELGVTAIELMPVGDFPGDRNWGYDGVAIFAPARCYGTPNDLQHLIDTAHRLGMAVLLDVVYNHLGPDGNYTGVFSPHYFSSAHQTPWGNGPNLDGDHSGPVREFFIDNALHWLREYHFDGLRFDAVHAIADDSRLHLLEELTERVRDTIPDRRIVLIAEDHRNLAEIVRAPESGGWGLDAVWADDFHHVMRRLLAGDHEGYFRDYHGTIEEAVTILNRGWLYVGQFSVHDNMLRGTSPTGLPASSFVICLQNHDQVGNRAFGERLHHQIDLAAYRAASAVLLTAPQTPLLFMGQEWAASSPFLYFTDHHPELGRMVTEGRRKEFQRFSAFADPTSAKRIPNPQSEVTYFRSRLRWDEHDREPHRGILDLYRTLLAIRNAPPMNFQAFAWGDDTIVLCHTEHDGSRKCLVARLRGRGRFHSSERPDFPFSDAGPWQLVLHTEEARFAPDAQVPELHLTNDIEIGFSRPGAVLLRS